MAGDDREIEIQLKVEKTIKLQKFLKQNAKFLYKTQQIDTYYTPAHRNFVKVKPVREWLRLRDSDGKYSITYKNWHYNKDGKSYHCDEYESKLDNLKSFQKLFSALDMKVLIVINKKRTVWKYRSYEISIDKVKGLGTFVEVEFSGKTDKSPKQISLEMIKFIKELDCGKIEINRQGYPYLLLFPKDAKFEEV